MRNHTNPTTRRALIAATVALATTPAVALAAEVGAAQAPEVGAQKALIAGQKAPATIPGTGLKKGATLKKGQKLVYRTVALADGGQARFTLSCGTNGHRLKGLGPAEGGKAIFNLVDRGSYVGKRSVRLKADAPKTAPDARGTMYALCVR